MSHLISDSVHVVKNDQDAINAAYQVAVCPLVCD
jgi:hypothetical protein